jgi:hypothetical protein
MTGPMAARLPRARLPSEVPGRAVAGDPWAFQHLAPAVLQQQLAGHPVCQEGAMQTSDFMDCVRMINSRIDEEQHKQALATASQI